MNSLPNDYNWQEYIYLNPDLTGMTENDAYYHYTGFGSHEKRKYKFDIPSNFNCNEYVLNSQTSKSFKQCFILLPYSLYIFNEVFVFQSHI